MATQQDTQAFFEKYRLLLNAGETLSLPVLGNSMSPFLVHQRDTVWLRKPDRPLRKGDIVLYQRSNGAYILHRICQIREESFTMIGDAHQTPEPGITRDQIFGLVVRIERKGKILEPSSFWWKFFSLVWIRLIPLRRFFQKVYALIFHSFRRSK